MTIPTYVTAPSTTGTYVLSDVTVVDVTDGGTTAHQDVHVRDGLVSHVTTHDPNDSQARVDAAGRFVVPAFVDSHAHPLNHPDEVDGAYALMLANGICGYRQMSGNDEVLRRRQEGTLRTPVGAPRLLALPGELLTPFNAGTEAAAARTVRHEAAHGADFIKAAFTSAKTFMAALRTANEVGVPLAGHLPGDLDPREAARAGVRCIEHLGPGTALAAAAATGEEKIRSQERSLPPMPRIPFADRIFGNLLLKMVVNPARRTNETTAGAYREADTTFDEAKARELADLFVEHGTWNCPTLIRVHTMQFADRPEHTEDPRQKYIHPDELAMWRDASADFAKLPQATRDTLAEHFDAQLRLTRILDDAGAGLLAGTDADGAGWVIPGFGLHDEFDLLARAGLSPLRILQMATLDPARFFGRQDRSGQVAPGYEADLVLLDADPTAGHEALHTVAGVVRDGGYHDRADLDAILNRLEAAPTAR